MDKKWFYFIWVLSQIECIKKLRNRPLHIKYMLGNQCFYTLVGSTGTRGYFLFLYLIFFCVTQYPNKIKSFKLYHKLTIVRNIHFNCISKLFRL